MNVTHNVLVVDAAFFGVLKDGLGSASELAKKAKKMKKAKQKVEDQNGEVLDHRPHDQHGPPLQILSNAFASFTEILQSGKPGAEDCKAATAMVALASQVKITCTLCKTQPLRVSPISRLT